MFSPLVAENSKIPSVWRGDDNISEPSRMLRNDLILRFEHGVGGSTNTTPRNCSKAGQIENPLGRENIFRVSQIALQTPLTIQADQGVLPISVTNQRTAGRRPPRQKCVR